MASMALTKRLKDAAKAGDCEVITDEINSGTYHVNQSWHLMEFTWQVPRLISSDSWSWQFLRHSSFFPKKTVEMENVMFLFWKTAPKLHFELFSSNDWSA